MLDGFQIAHGRGSFLRRLYSARCSKIAGPVLRSLSPDTADAGAAPNFIISLCTGGKFRLVRLRRRDHIRLGGVFGIVICAVFLLTRGTRGLGTDTSIDHEPLGPMGTLGRFGLLLIIVFAFAMTARFLVGALR
jgi:hypothetical protein